MCITDFGLISLIEAMMNGMNEIGGFFIVVPNCYAENIKTF